MKYISFIDQLGLDINELSQIDSNGIIKLQKQLKAKAMMGDANNLGDISNLIDKLKDETVLQHHVFIEKHDWLKQLISGNHQNIKQNQISVDESLIVNLDDLKYFLSPFFKENLKLFLSETLTKGKYVLLLKVLSHNNLFSEENNQLIINFFKARLNYASVYLREGRLKEKEFPIAFITNKVFINCLNEYPDCFNEDMQELNSEVIDIYNSNRRNTSNQEFRFASKAMVAFAILDTSNVFLKETLVSNADIARQYSYPSKSNKKTGSGFGGWSIFVIVMIVIRVIFWVGKSSNSSNDYDYIRSGDYSSSPVFSDELQKLVDSIQRSGSTDDTFTINEELIEALGIEETVIEDDHANTTTSDRYKLADHTKFIYTLKRKVERKTSDEILGMTLNPFSNPYQTTFNQLPYSEDLTHNAFLKINNRSKKDLIVFRLTHGIDQSIYIPKGERVSIEANQNDSLLFYTGTDFVSSRFSHFKRDTDLSNLYKITDYNISEAKEIIIYPFEDIISKVKSSSSNKILIDTVRGETIKTNKVTLKQLSINKIYTDWYNKKYKN
ncbi:hypothetical protein [Psychroserpens damuponensis]|uniref:hypothetical protein n=1 Tax=Psychroserpens damuponensis TaxID=943936 RepID=UPI00058D18FE|nr:hypothetical protein [Psychroserpens damuponensis]